MFTAPELTFKLCDAYRNLILKRATRDKLEIALSRVELVLIGIPEDNRYRLVASLRPLDGHFKPIWNFVVNTPGRDTVDQCLSDLTNHVNIEWSKLEQ